MSDFTIEQLEALKEGKRLKQFIGPSRHLELENRDLIDALIAEKRAHAELRKRIEDRIWELKQPLCSHMPEGDELDDYLAQWGMQSYAVEILAEILKGPDGNESH